MTNYGTIPTSSAAAAAAASSADYISRAKERIKEGLGTRRAWKVMLDRRAIGLPSGVGEALLRARTNAAFFRVNYAMVGLGILFLSLLWHPVSLIVFLVMMTAWLFLYFLRDEPLVVLRRQIDDRVVLAALAVLTVALLLLTRATLNILIAVLVAVVVLAVHAVLRKTDDLFLDEEASGLMTGVASSSSS